MTEVKNQRAKLVTKEPENSIFGRLLIITYEMGDLTRDIFYANRFPEEREAHLANVSLSIADLLVQLSLLCKELGLDEEELRRLGWNHLQERYQEFQKRGWAPV
jgi:hypothetical protein